MFKYSGSIEEKNEEKIKKGVDTKREGMVI